MIVQILMKALAALGVIGSAIFVTIGVLSYLDGLMPFQVFWLGSCFGVSIWVVCVWVLFQGYPK